MGNQPSNYQFKVEHEIKDHVDSITTVRCNGVVVISSSNDGCIRTHHVKDLKRTTKKDFHSCVNHIALLTRKTLLVATNSGRIFGFNLEKMTTEKEFKFHKDPVLNVTRVSNDVFVSCDYEGNIFFCSYFEGEILWKIKENFNNYYFPRIYMLKSGRNNMFLLSTTDHYRIKLIQERKIVDHFEGHKSFVYALDSIYDKKKKEEIIFSGGADQMIISWSLSNGRILKKIKTESEVWSILHYKNFLICGLGNGSLELYNYCKNQSSDKFKKKLRSLKIHDKSICSLAWMNVKEEFHPIFLTASNDNIIKIIKMFPK